MIWMKFLIILISVLGAMSVSPSSAEDPVPEEKRSPAEIVSTATDTDWRAVNPAQLIVFELESGDIVIELSDTFAQGHVAQMKRLVSAGFYDGLSFYRVIEGFVAQGGDVSEEKPLPDGAIEMLAAEFDEDWPGGFDPQMAAAFADGYAEMVTFHKGFPVGADKSGKRAWLLHCTGAMAMARDVERNTAGTEFYITLQPQRYLDRNLTVFGRVLDGMTHVQGLTRQAPPQSESEPRGDIILRAWTGDTPPDGKAIPQYRALRTDTPLFAEYIEARKNRPSAFFYYRPDHADICQLPIPTEQVVPIQEDNE